jgi:hemoglobin
MTLHHNSGGDEMLALAVEDLYKRLLTDQLLAPWFVDVDLAALKEHQRAFLAVVLGGPEAYDGRSMRNAHTGMAITNEAYTAMLGHLTDALEELSVEPEALGQIVKRIETMRAAIVAVH